MMRSTARINQPIHRTYATLLGALARISTQLWTFDPAKAPQTLHEGELDLLVVAKLSRCFNRRVQSSANFAVRGTDMPDDATSDDWFNIEWQPKANDFASLVTELLPKYITAFRPYRATLGPDELAALDFDRERGLNERYQVGRIYPVDYLHGNLCQSAFKKTPKQCAKLLCRAGILAEEFEGGLLLRQPVMLSTTQCDDLNSIGRSALMPEGS